MSEQDSRPEGGSHRSDQDRRPRPGGPSLRARWFRHLAVVIGMLLVTSAVHILGARGTAEGFRGAAQRLEEEAAVLSRLRSDIVTAAVLRSGAVQGIRTDPVALAAAQAAEDASFEEAIEVLRPGGGREEVERYRQLSEALMPDDVTTLSPGEFLTRAFQGQANFSLLEEAGQATRELARSDISDTARLEGNVTLATALLGLVAALLIARFSRRLSSEVLTPVARLRDSARRLASGDLDHRVDVDRVDEMGELAATFNIMADAVSLSHRQLTFQVNHDPLTGLANRTAFQARLEAMLAQPERRDAHQAVILVDLDDFKALNDRLGHAAGDAALRATAGRLSQVVRPGDLVARLGGDEFAILLDRLADQGVAKAIAHRAVTALADPLDVGGTSVEVGASIGLAVRHEASNATGLVREADIAMYAAKRLGKHRVQAYDASLHPVLMDQASNA